MGKRGRRRARGETPFESLIAAAMVRWGADARADARVVEELERGGTAAGRAIEEMAATALDERWHGGWTPATVVHVMDRVLSDRHGDAAAALVIAESARRRAEGDALHPRWEAQVNILAEERAARSPDVRMAMELLAQLIRLPEVPPTLPPPGDPEARAEVHLAGLDGRVLARVRALLAKAESTEFEAEAEALTAKAQELIARHAVDEMALHRDEDVGAPSVRHVLLDDPYMDAKSALLGAVAAANRCKAVFNPAFGWITVFGYESDLDAVELLGASLLAQATGAMARLGPQRDHRGRSRTKSFRRAFLYGFADRIGVRLARATEEQVDAAEHGDLLPVLAQRDDRVAKAVTETFPNLRYRSTKLTNGGGYDAGQVAAQNASLDVASGALR